MSNSTRDRIAAAFERELAESPVPPSLRTLAIREAVAAPRHRSNQPQLLALVAAILVVAVVATLVIGSHLLHPNAIPAKPTGSTTPPSPRSQANLVYDTANRNLVLFGGATIDIKVVNETWTWDGKYWTLHRAAVAPASRFGAVMAYDEAHHDVVLYGGFLVSASGKGGQTSATDTWAWNGTAWKEQHPLHQPALSFDWPATMQFDPVSRTVLLFGFKKATSQSQAAMNPETWSWNGSDWIQLAPAASPVNFGEMVSGGTYVYLLAPAAGRVGGRYVSQMWQWEGGTWRLLPATNNELSPVSSAAFDPQHGRIVGVNGDTWTWDGSRWTRQHVSAQPPAVGYLVYFPPLHEVISFGSLFGNTNNDVWAWTGSTWNKLEAGTVGPLPSPSGELGPTTPAAVDAFVRQTVKTTSPVLLPTWLPAGMEARVTATADGFNLDYASDQRDKQIFLGTVVPNPPPGTPGSSDTPVKFRSAIPQKYGQSGYAEYFVYDPTAPLSARWLVWNEPGTMAVQQTKAPGVPYFLSAEGLTDQEFWQVANSLK